MVILGRNRPADDLFDDTSGYEDETGVKVSATLTEEERKQATVLYRLFGELWGVCLVVGNPGTGKDLFGNVIAYKLKKYFPWKRVLRDEKPRALFGEYAGLFNDKILAEDLLRMKEVAKGAGATRIDAALEKAADDWVSSRGQVLLKNSVLYLTEFWRYCYNREPHNPMNKTMGGIHKQKRHLDALVIGTGQLESELDKFTCLPWVDWKVTCGRSTSNPTGFAYWVTRVAWDARKAILVPMGKPFSIAFDAGKPRSDIGDGKLRVWNERYIPMTEEERIVLDCIRAGVDTYEDLVELLETEGDMEEWETLATLKTLKFSKLKRAVDFPCLFAIYNSKSPPQMGTALKVED